MGGPKPWPTRWPEPAMIPFDPQEDQEPLGDPDYDVEEYPPEDPYRLPEEQLFPYSVTWAVTRACNLHCPHCYDVVQRTRADLTTAQALDVVDRLAQAGITFVVFSGGEPLLRDDLFQLMAHCREQGLGIAMRSNGTAVTASVAQRLAELGLEVAGISLDGATARAHERVRGPGTFKKTLDGIAELLAAGLRVNVEVVLGRRNARQGLQFVRLAQQLGVQELNFSALAPQGRAGYQNQDMLDHGLWQELVAALYQASLTARVAVSPSCALTGACWACVEPNITCDGWVTPCYLSPECLFHVFDAPPAQFRELLRQNRATTLNTCGRGQWVGHRALRQLALESLAEPLQCFAVR